MTSERDNRKLLEHPMTPIEVRSNLNLYSGVPNRRTGLNKRTGWKYIKKLINAQGLIIIIL